MSQEAHSALTDKTLQQYGGQAVVEGVMMRSPHYFAVACRKPDGEIVVQREEVDRGILSRLKWLNKPFLRGTLALLDAMILGTRALTYAAHVQLEAERAMAAAGKPGPHHSAAEEATVATVASGINSPPTRADAKMPASGRINDIHVAGALLFTLALVVVFRSIPTLLSELADRYIFVGATSNIVLNAFDGLVRMALFLIYILLISLMPQIQEVFRYHGAEHKAINTLEAGLPLTRENALAASRIHPRCGTSFIFVVFFVDLLVVLFLPRPVWYLRVLLHLAVLPFVAGLAYEVIKAAGNYRNNPLVMLAFAPGMSTQYLTTREPTPAQVDVALAALYSVLEAEGKAIPGMPPNTPNPDEPEMVTA